LKKECCFTCAKKDTCKEGCARKIDGEKTPCGSVKGCGDCYMYKEKK